jgi:hypothetical protein
VDVRPLRMDVVCKRTSPSPGPSHAPKARHAPPHTHTATAAHHVCPLLVVLRQVVRHPNAEGVPVQHRPQHVNPCFGHPRPHSLPKKGQHGALFVPGSLVPVGTHATKTINRTQGRRWAGNNRHPHAARRHTATQRTYFTKACSRLSNDRAQRTQSMTGNMSGER